MKRIQLNLKDIMKDEQFSKVFWATLLILMRNKIIRAK